MLTCTVSPTEGGKIFVNGVEYVPNCGYTGLVNLQAVPSTGYKFSHWTGNVTGTTGASTTINMQKEETVAAYFVFLTQAQSLNQAKNLININKDLIVVDVSSAGDFNNSHMLCARTYPWNSATKQFDVSVTNLNPYKNRTILMYDRNGSKSKDAADFLALQGFSSIYYMTDGLDDWMAAGYETFTTAEDSGVCTCIPPMAYAGPDKTAAENSSVTLNGMGWDPDGGAVTYLWTQTQGANAALSNPRAAQPTFRAPDLTSGSDELIFHLTVTDNEGDKDTDSVAVNVGWNNQPPVANAGVDKTAKGGSTVTLIGSMSRDPESTATLIYDWSVSNASGVSAPTISNKAAKNPTFVAPNKDGWVEFRLVVTDNGGLTSTDSVKITIQNSPNGLTATATSSSTAVLGWNDNSGNETGFIIEKKTGACGSTNAWTPIAPTPTVAANKTTYTVSGLTANTVYSFRAKASASGGDSGYSNCAGATTGLASTPNSPMNLIASSISPTQVNLTWTDRSSNETGFELWRKAGSGVWAKLTATNANVAAFSDTSVNSSTIYQYRVKACNAKGCSPFSNIVSIPGTPTGLTATAGSQAGTIGLAWTDASSNETGFEIYRKTGSCASGGTWARVAVLGANVKAWTNSGLAPGVYSYKIRTYCRSAMPFGFGYSQWSNCDDATAP